MPMLSQVLDCSLVTSSNFGRALLIEERGLTVLKVVDLELIPALLEFLTLRDAIGIRDTVSNLYIKICDVGVSGARAEHLDQIRYPLLVLHMVGVVD